MYDDKADTTITCNSAAVSAGKLFLFLFFLPYMITFFHIRNNINAYWYDTILVDVKTAGISSIASGIYGRKSSERLNDEIRFYKMLKIGKKPTNRFGIYQPDVLDSAESAVITDHEFPYLSIIPTTSQGNVSEPCISLSKGNKICGNDVIHTSSTSMHSTKISSTTTTKKHWIHHVLFEIPATSFLIFFNCTLAFMYWNKRVSPDTVAKIYSRIIPSTPQSSAPSSTEVWRVLTGSTAHFEPLHLGMNMLSLSALGKELEGRQTFTSISFFMYNLSLIVVVPTIWLGMQRALQKYYPSTFDANGATVGYSGVLFAWMVVASLGQTSTCPIIFAPDICFPTYELFGPFKFSFSPLVQLAVMQMILPRVSFTGHLSGIIAGFLIHWEWIPIRYFQPAPLLPILYLIYLWKIRRATAMTLDFGERLQGAMSRFRTILGYQVVMLIYSLTVLGPINATTVSYAVTIAYWYQLGHSLSRIDDPYNDTSMWSKGYIFCAVLVLITDAMTMGGWAAFLSLKAMPSIVLVLRAILLLISMIEAQETISKTDDGIFEWAFNYTILYPCQELGRFYPWLKGSTSDSIPQSSTVLPVRSASGFDGVGHRLGGSTSHPTNPWKVQRNKDGKLQSN